MTIFTSQAARARPVLELQDVDFGTALGAAARTGLYYSPGASLNRLRQLERARIGTISQRVDGRRIRVPIDDNPMMSPEEANEEFGRDGLTWSQPVRRRVAELEAQWHDQRALLQSRRDRAPGGVVIQAAMLGADMAGTMADPLSIGAAFVPVVGQSRFLQMAQRMGPTRARLARGGIEGTVGTAALEPLVLGAAIATRDPDYGLTDSLLNIAFGGALGGGLHLAGGAISDRLARMRGQATLRDRIATARAADGLAARIEAAAPETREMLMRAAVGQAASGRRIDVSTIARRDPALADLVDRSPDDPFGAEFDRLVAEAQADYDRLPDDFDRPRPPPAAERWTAGQQGENGRFIDYRALRPREVEILQDAVAELQRTRGGSLEFRDVPDGPGMEVRGVRGDTPDWFRDHNIRAQRERTELRRQRRRNEKLPEDQRQEVPRDPVILTRQKVADVAQKLIDGRPLGRAEAEVAEVVMGEVFAFRSENARQMAEFRAAREAESQASIDAQARADIEDAMADQEASRQAAEAVGQSRDDVAAVTEDLAAIDPEMRRLEQDGELDADMLADLERGRLEAEALNQRADLYRAAAGCMVA